MPPASRHRLFHLLCPRALATIRRIDVAAFTGYLSGRALTEEMIAAAKALGCRMSGPIETTPRRMAGRIQ